MMLVQRPYAVARLDTTVAFIDSVNGWQPWQPFMYFDVDRRQGGGDKYATGQPMCSLGLGLP